MVQRTIACFGEMLWDCLPEGLFPGGAPMNVAIHLAALGQSPMLISAVGDDFLGRELVRRLDLRKVNRSLVAVLPDVQTGVVQASLDDQGNATYDIREGVAWDHIPPPSEEIPPLSALVFGSLALRSRTNRSTLNLFLEGAQPEMLRVFDVNLRPPFDPLDRITDWAARADLLKMNEDEASRVTGTKGTPESLARDLIAAYPQASICVTAGSRGAGLLRNGQWTWVNAPKTEVADTVGAGDSFLAALLAGWMRGESSEAMLDRAVRVAAFVASKRGATPELPAELTS